MFDKFSTNVFTAIALAQRQALSVGCLEVSPDHLLAGLSRLKNDSAGELLRANCMDVKTEFDLTEPSKDIPLSTQSKLALELAWKIAQELNEKECGTLHLLAALKRLDRNGQLSNLDVPGVQATDSNSPDLQFLDSKTIEERIQIWQNRADMARKRGNADLEEQALEQKQKYELLLKQSQNHQ